MISENVYKHEEWWCRKHGIGFCIQEDIFFYFIPQRKLKDQKLLTNGINYVIASHWDEERNTKNVVYPFPFEQCKDWPNKAIQMDVLKDEISKSEFNRLKLLLDERTN